MSTPALWTVSGMADAMKAERAGALPESVHGLSIDSRTITPGEAFFALTGERTDGHAYVGAACEKGAGLAVVAADRRADVPADAPLLIVPDVLDALRDLAVAARARSSAQIVAITGSVGKTSTKEALQLALRADGETHASAASFNNHFGVPLSLARMPETARYGVFEIGMNHRGEITPLVELVRPHVAIITTVAPVHLVFFESLNAIADAKAEIFAGVEPGGAAILNHDNPYFARLKRRAKAAGITRIISFGEHARPQARLIKCVLHPDSSVVEASILGETVDYRIGAPGRHLVLNSLAVLATARVVGADLALAALALANQVPAPGRGTRITLDAPGGPSLLIDESYNANPNSMRAALSLLGQAPVGPHGRRIAVLGDMLELGPAGAELHRAIAEQVTEYGIDLVFCAGPLMAALWEALPANRRGAHAATAEDLELTVLGAVRGGDALMVKGSNGSRMGPIVKSLTRRYAPRQACDDVPAQG